MVAVQESREKVDCMCDLDFSDLLGKTFVNGGRGPEKYDCYGLATEVFRRFGIELPDYRISCEDASLINQTVESERNQWISCIVPQVPALVVLRFNSHLYNHVGVYIGDGKFIHTAKKTGVRLDRISDLYWKHRIEGYYVPSQEVIE